MWACVVGIALRRGAALRWQWKKMPPCQTQTQQLSSDFFFIPSQPSLLRKSHSLKSIFVFFYGQVKTGFQKYRNKWNISRKHCKSGTKWIKKYILCIKILDETFVSDSARWNSVAFKLGKKSLHFCFLFWLFSERLFYSRFWLLIKFCELVGAQDGVGIRVGHLKLSTQ